MESMSVPVQISYEPVVPPAASPQSKREGFGARKYKGDVNLRLEQSSLFPKQTRYDLSASESLPFDRGVGPLTSVMMSSAHATRHGYEDDEYRPSYGPLTTIMLQSGGMHTSMMQQSMHPFILAPCDDLQISPLPAQFTHSTDICKTPGDALSFTNSSLSSLRVAHAEFSNLSSDFQGPLEPLPSLSPPDKLGSDFNQAAVDEIEQQTPVSTKFDWPNPKEVLLSEVAPATHVGANYYERKVLTNLDRLTTTRKMTLSVLDKIDFNPTKRTKSKKRRFPAPKLVDLAADFKEPDAAPNRVMCKFAGCCFNQVGFVSKNALKKHVEQDHFAEKIVCPWCNNTYSRSDAATRHIKRTHSMSQKKAIVAKKQRDQRSLIANRFILSASSFLPSVKGYYTMLVQGSLRPYARREKIEEDSSFSESEESSDKLSTESLDSSKEAIIQETALIPESPKTRSSLQCFLESEVTANAKISFVLATDPYKDHVRDLFAGTIDTNSMVRKVDL